MWTNCYSKGKISLSYNGAQVVHLKLAEVLRSMYDPDFLSLRDLIQLEIGCQCQSCSDDIIRQLQCCTIPFRDLFPDEDAYPLQNGYFQKS